MTEGAAFLFLAIMALSLIPFDREDSFGAPGIWLPFGVGVSRTEYAYGAFDLVLFAYPLQRLWGYVHRRIAAGAVKRLPTR